MGDYKKLIELLRDHVVYIQTHNFPDPDAMASAYGLQQFLLEHGVNSTLCYDGKIEKLSTRKMLDVFNIEIKCIEEIPEMREEDYIVTVDAQKYNANVTDFIGDEIACIDHHPTYISCEYEYKDVRQAGACATLITEYYVKSNTAISSNTAAALLYGIKMDTNGLSRGVTDLDIEMFGFLHKHAEIAKVTDMQTSLLELEDLRAYGAAIESIKVYDKMGFASIPFDCPDGLIAMVSDFILSLDVVDFAVVYSEREDGLKFSVRSSDVALNAGTIINDSLIGLGSGGGHASMAGGFVTRENLDKIGAYYQHIIREDFLNTYRKAKGFTKNETI